MVLPVMRGWCRGKFIQCFFLFSGLGVFGIMFVCVPEKLCFGRSWNAAGRPFSITFVAYIAGRKTDRRGLATTGTSLKSSREGRNGCKPTLLHSRHCRTTYWTRTCWKTSTTWLSSNIQVCLLLPISWAFTQLKIYFCNALLKITCCHECFRY